MIASTKAWIVAGVIAALVGLWLIKGILEAGAARQAAIAHKIEVRRSSPARIRFLQRLRDARNKGVAFAEHDPGGVEVTTIDLAPGVPVELDPGLEIQLTEVKP